MQRSGRSARRVVALAMALVVALGVAHAQPQQSALAAPAPPSWDDVEAAKGDVEATEVAVARIRESAEAMNAELEQLRIAALIAGEQYQSAMLALDEATTTMTIADRRRDAALERAEASGQQAAQLATQLARAGGGDLTMALMVSGDNADELLYRLGTMSALSGRTNDVLSRAVADRNVAAALSDQAVVARDAHAELVADAESSYTVAAVAAGDAEDRAAAQQELLDDLSAKLAELTGRSVALEREYLDSLETPPSGPSPSPSAPAPSPSAPAPSPTQPNPTQPNPSSPAPSTSSSGTPPTSAPTPSSPPPAALQPNATAVAAAIAFARAQVGEPYQFAAAGPDAWDCSGLTMMAYSAAGLSIGGHGSTAQYTRASSRGVLVPYSQVLPGDLIFYSSGGSTSASKYHVALYIGDGLMIEAPYPGKPVRIVPVRSFDRVGLVARPSA